MPRAGMFIAVSHANFRWFWLNTAFWSAGIWMEMTVLGWLVLELTDSPLLLGLVMASRGIPLLLFGSFSGVLADRMDRRWLQAASQLAVGIFSLLMGILISTGVIQVWHVVTITVLSGTARTISLPARQAFLYDIVGRDNLLNGIAMNRIAQDATRIIGPALGGGLIVLIGTAGCFYIMGVSFILGSAVLFLIRSVPRLSVTSTSAWQNLIDGLRYVKSNRTVLLILSIEIVTDTFAFSYYTMLPVFARDILGVGAPGLGFMMSASGVGALLGLVVVAMLGNYTHKGWLLLGSSMAFGGALILFSISPWYPLSLVLLAAAGAAGSMYDTAVATLLQVIVTEEMRGRVMGIYVLTWGMSPVGSAQAGAVASLFGVNAAVAIGGAVTVIYAILIAFRSLSVRRS